MSKKNVKAVVFILAIIFARFLLGGDFLYFFQWWLTILILGLVFLPITNLVFHKFNDKGYLFSKTIGIAITGYIMWLLSSLRILKFSPLACMLSLILGIILNLSILFFQTRKDKSGNNVSKALGLSKDVMDVIFKEEILFFILFLVFVYIRGFKPEAHGTEKFMDYGFMTSMFRSDYMPPEDFWFSGSYLNYYYIGQFFATFLTKLSFVPVSRGYNLMLMMIAAFTFMLSYSIVYNLMQTFIRNKGIKKKNNLITEASAIFGGLLVTFAGSMHYPIYRWIVPTIEKVKNKAEVSRYWFPDATRFIGYNPDTSDKTIHEFPAYSFILGDLHAHVLNLLFILTVLGILLGWLYSRKDKKINNVNNKGLLAEIFQPAHILIGFLLGIFQGTNLWDFPIYLVVAGAIILFSNIIVHKFKGRAVGITLIQGLFIIAIAFVFILPFTINFDAMSTRVVLVENTTPIWQLLILWGLPVGMLMTFLFFMISDFRKKKIIKKSRILSFMENLEPSTLYIITIALCAFGLVLIPEIVYVEDIYSGDYKRANTMFKLTYQAFVMFAISLAYIIPRLLIYGKSRLRTVVATIGLLLCITTLGYSVNGTKSWYGNIFDRDGYKGIDAAAFMEEEMPEDYLATMWLNENIEGNPTVLEANGDSYTNYQRVSVITGLPTVLGWHTHEWLWKSDRSIVDARAADVLTIYTSENSQEVESLIDKYNISYIYVGELEQEKYEGVNDELLQSLGEVVYPSKEWQEKGLKTYIIQVGD